MQETEKRTAAAAWYRRYVVKHKKPGRFRCAMLDRDVILLAVNIFGGVLLILIPYLTHYYISKRALYTSLQTTLTQGHMQNWYNKPDMFKTTTEGFNSYEADSS